MIRMNREGDDIGLQAPPHRKDQARMIPGARFDSKKQSWRYPLSWAVCVAARGVFGAELEIGPELAEWARGERVRISEIMTARAEAMEVE